MRAFFAYFVPIVLTFTIGALGYYLQGEALVEWYPSLVKSSLTPPAIVFVVAWGVLYLLIGVSAGTMHVRGDMSVMRLWLLQLLLNFLWSVCFFEVRLWVYSSYSHSMLLCSLIFSMLRHDALLLRGSSLLICCG